jgi:hypothetical protein
MQVRNVLDVSLDLWTANVLVEATMKVAESRFYGLFPLQDILDASCWLAMIPAPTLDSCVFALGLPACQAYYQEQQQQGSSIIFSGAEHHPKLVQSQFLVASDNVTIGPTSFSRKAESTVHVVSNILPIDETANTNTFRGTPLTVFDTATQ